MKKRPFTQKINVRVAIIVAVIGVVLSLSGSLLVFRLAHDKQETVSYRLIDQLAASAVKTAAIAAYVDDEELANEIINGLVMSDMVSGARIFAGETVLAMNIANSDELAAVSPIERELYHPFNENELIGELALYPDTAFIRDMALQEAKGSAIHIIVVSFLITLIIAGTLQYTLSMPLIKLKQAFETVDPSHPENLKKLDIGYKRQDELGYLIKQINGLIRAVRANFLAERKLRVHTEKLEQQLRLLFEKASIGVALISTRKGILIENPKFNHIVGTASSLADFIGIFDDPESVSSIIGSLKASLHSNPIGLDLSYQEDGSRRWVHCLFATVSDQRLVAREDDDVLFEVIIHDITDRKEREAEVRYQAQHDILTGLYNRLGGEKRLQYLLSENTGEFSCVFLLVDLDKFKPINDNYGHEAGDVVLVECSHRIKTLFNEPTDVCCRWGGDEFVIGFKREALPFSALNTLCNTLLHSLEEPIEVSSDLQVSISASIGVALVDEAGKSVEHWIAKADKAMYDVKSQGRANYLIK
tara:strand:+ start:2070 stop:3662 length:1593 start_codon:yes stop_codon:yes gene_type:complete